MIRRITTDDIVRTISRAIADYHPHLRLHGLGDDRLECQLDVIALVPGGGNQHIWPVISRYVLTRHFDILSRPRSRPCRATEQVRAQDAWPERLGADPAVHARS